MSGLDRPTGEVFLDARGNGRAMRLTWHHEADLVVLSMWRDGTCAGTFRLCKEDVTEFIDALIDGLRDAPGVQMSASAGSHRGAAEAAAAGPTTRTVGPSEPIHPIETGESTFPEFSDADDEPAPSFTEWAFRDDRANAS